MTCKKKAIDERKSKECFFKFPTCHVKKKKKHKDEWWWYYAVGEAFLQKRQRSWSEPIEKCIK